MDVIIAVGGASRDERTMAWFPCRSRRGEDDWLLVLTWTGRRPGSIFLRGGRSSISRSPGLCTHYASAVKCKQMAHMKLLYF